jgi:hypothetical protein
MGGDFHHLGCTHEPTFINGPISASSTRIPIVCSSVQEAELAGTFGAAKIATVEPQTLADLGYPQPPTITHCDNEVAVGIANRTVKPKLSKSCDMRLHWLQDRVAQLHFLVRHIPGLLNIADFFTKTLPISRHNFFAPFIAVDDPATALPQRLDLSYSHLIFPCIVFSHTYKYHAGVLILIVSSINRSTRLLKIVTIIVSYST